jgi:aromatic-L-amino-acid decarboxylase
MAAYTPMSIEEFRRRAHELADWMADFLATVEQRPVRSQAQPGEILAQLPETPPEAGEPFDSLMEDFKEIVLPGITHWQHPSFFAYFPANSSYPSVLAEMLTATLGAQGMVWQTSPAATEMEERVMDWIRQMIGLPAGFHGVIQDTASTSTLCALLTAREKVSGYRVNEEGFYSDQRLTLYASSQTHSSIEKGAKIAGFGRRNLREIEVDDTFAMRPDRLEERIDQDIREGLRPTCVVATLGTTGSTAVDPLKESARVCREREIWLHVDAALAGSAMVLPELRWMQDGMEEVDSYVFNPHKWMFTNFDSSAYFVKDPEALKRTFEIHPEYLKTKEGRLVNNYRDWGIQLGRRFRSLKLWFVIRTYGVAGIRRVIRSHLELAHWVRDQVEGEKDFELLAPVTLNTVCLRYVPETSAPPEAVNELNERILEAVNRTGEAYFTHTKLNGRYTIRFMVGQTYTEARHVEAAWKLLRDTARSMK